MGQTKPLHNNQKRMTACANFRDLGGADLYNQLINSFRIYLCKFNILGWCEPEDIMSESLVRYVEALKCGKIIYNIEAWLRSTGFNVVREFSRQRKDGKARVTFVDTRVLDSFASSHSNNVKDLVMEEEYSTLYKAMQKLDTKTQELLYMRYFEKLSSTLR